jgi:hypothetical protein
MRTPEWITLSRHEVDSARQAARDSRGIAQESITRYARPDEREAAGRETENATRSVGHRELNTLT